MANPFEQIFKPFFGFDVASIYLKAGMFIDFVIYLIFFIAIMKYAVSKKFDGPAAKSLSTILGIMFAIGMSVFSVRFGFNIGSLAPLAGLVFFIVIGFLCYSGIKRLGGGSFASGAVAFFIVYLIIQAIIPQYMQWISQKIPILSTLLWIVFWVAAFGVFNTLFKAGRGTLGGVKESGLWDTFKGAGSGAAKGVWSGAKWAAPKLKKLWQKIDAEADKEKYYESNLNRILMDIEALEGEEDDLFNNEEYLLKNEYEKLKAVKQGMIRLKELRDEWDKLDMYYENMLKNPFKEQFREKLDQIDARLENYYQRYIDYKSRLEQEFQKLVYFNNESTKRLFNNLDKDVRELEQAVGLLDKEYDSLINQYEYYKGIIQEANIDGNLSAEEKEKYMNRLRHLHGKIKQVLEYKKGISGRIDGKKDVIKHEKEITILDDKESKIVEDMISMSHQMDEKFRLAASLEKQLRADYREDIAVQRKKLLEDARNLQERFFKSFEVLYGMKISAYKFFTKVKELNKKITQENKKDHMLLKGMIKEHF